MLVMIGGLKGDLRELTERWRRAPLIEKMELDFLMVHRDGSVEGFHHALKQSII